MPNSIKSKMAVVLGAMMLLCITLVNGHPFFYPDTGNYVREPDAALVWAFGPRFATSWTDPAVIAEFYPTLSKPAITSGAKATRSIPSSEANAEVHSQPSHTNSLKDGLVLAGRSAYYGLLLYVGELSGGFWLSVCIQALVVAYVIFVLIVRCLGLSLRSFFGCMAILACFSTLPFFVGFLMPDVFTGVTILVTAILITFWADLTTLERCSLSFILVFSVLTHLTHLLICASMLMAYVVVTSWNGVHGLRSRSARIGTLTACVLAGVLGEIAFGLVVSKVVGFAPVRPPFLTASLIQMGPGYQYLKANCMDHSLAVCQFLNHLPISADTFIWDPNPAVGVFAPASAEMKRALDSEQLAFALKVVAFDPIGVAGSVLRAGFRQLVGFGLSEFRGCNQCENIYSGLPPKYSSEVPESFAFRHGWVIGQLAKADYAVVILSCCFLVTVATSYFFHRPGTYYSIEFGNHKTSPIWLFSAVGIGISANALICGSLSGVYDRFEARVIWLVPLAAIVVFLISYKSKLATSPGTNSEHQLLESRGSVAGISGQRGLSNCGATDGGATSK